MKKAIIAILATTILFILGIFATFYTMPYIAPDLVEQTQWRIDSTQMVKDGTFPDSLLNPEEVWPIDTVTLVKPLNVLLTGLRDSLDTLGSSLGNEIVTKDSLLARVQEMEKRWDMLQAKYDEAKQMSTTISKLEDRELAELLATLDEEVLESLYVEASARNRTRLLQMMPAEKAAVLVNALTNPGQSFTSATNPDPALPNQ